MENEIQTRWMKAKEKTTKLLLLQKKTVLHSEGIHSEIGLRGGGLKIKCNEIKSKTVKERIISSASVEYVILV